MKIECITEKLLAAVSKASRCVAKGSEVKTLEALYLSAEGDLLTIRATNLEIGIQIAIQAKIERPGEVLVPTQLFLQFLSTVQSKKTVTLELVEGTILVSAPGVATKIKAIAGDETPTVPQIESEFEFTLPSEKLLQGLRAVWWSAATTGIKPELSSVYISAQQDTLVFAATDSFRLAEKRMQISGLPEFGHILLPYKNAMELAKVLEGLDKIDILITKNNLAIRTESLYFLSRLVEGTFPNYNAIIPKEKKTTLVILKQDFLEALRSSTIFSDRFYQLQFMVTKDTVTIETKSADTGESSVQLPAVVEGEPLEIRFNYRYIIDCLQNISTDSVSCDLNGPGKPMVIRSVGETGFLYLVMPMNR